MTALSNAELSTLANPTASSWSDTPLWDHETGDAGLPGPYPLDSHALQTTVEFSTLDDVVAVAITGEIDVVAARAFSLALGDLLHNARGGVVVDLTGIAFLGTAGLAALTGFHHAAHAQGIDWAIVGSHAVLRPLQVMGLDLPVCSTIEEARAGAAAGFAGRRSRP